MTFGIYLPPQAEKEKCPVLYYLSGLTCTEQNFVTKAGAQKYATEHGLILVAPDTSPRGLNLTGEDEAYDFGTGAGFYIDASEDLWKTNYRMYSYVTKELPEVIEKNFSALPGKKGIFGHSMGGHGALICSLKNPGAYQSVSAFAPICNPSACPWGEKAFTGYLGGDNKDAWKAWDTCELLAGGAKFPGGGPVLVDQGGDDQFLSKGQLLPDSLTASAVKAGSSVELRMQPGYDHSYFFIATFMEDHIRHHAKLLK